MLSYQNRIDPCDNFPKDEKPQFADVKEVLDVLLVSSVLLLILAINVAQCCLLCLQKFDEADPAAQLDKLGFMS